MGERVANGRRLLDRWAGRAGLLARGPLGAVIVLVLIIWLLLPLVPEESGVHFGWPYRLFFTAIVLAGGLFFQLLRVDRAPQPVRTWRVLGSIGLVFAVSVGLLVMLGNVYPQFEIPKAGEEAAPVAAAAEARGEQLFWNPNNACFLCHSIAGRGGQRAPDLSGVGTRAATRVPGLPAAEYIAGHIQQGSSFSFNVPAYDKIMPPFKDRLTEAEIGDLVAFLLSLK